MGDEPPKRIARTMFLICILLVEIITLVVLLVRNTNTNYETVSLSANLSYVYSVSVPPQEDLDNNKRFTGGIAENGVEAEVDLKVPQWDIISPITEPERTQGFWQGHRAVDLINNEGNDEVFAVADGIVVYAGWITGYGYRIEIDHGNGFVTTYSHLREFRVEKRDEVKIGDIIGIIGSTGKSTGTHLHFEIIYEGVKINPEPYL